MWSRPPCSQPAEHGQAAVEDGELRCHRTGTGSGAGERKDNASPPAIASRFAASSPGKRTGPKHGLTRRPLSQAGQDPAAPKSLAGAGHSSGTGHVHTDQLTARGTQKAPVRRRPNMFSPAILSPSAAEAASPPRRRLLRTATAGYSSGFASRERRRGGPSRLVRLAPLVNAEPPSASVSAARQPRAGGFCPRPHRRRPRVRRAAVQRLSDVAVLAEVAGSDSDAGVRGIAVGCCWRRFSQGTRRPSGSSHSSESRHLVAVAKKRVSRACARRRWLDFGAAGLASVAKSAESGRSVWRRCSGRSRTVGRGGPEGGGRGRGLGCPGRVTIARSGRRRRRELSGKAAARRAQASLQGWLARSGRGGADEGRALAAAADAAAASLAAQAMLATPAVPAVADEPGRPSP